MDAKGFAPVPPLRGWRAVSAVGPNGASTALKAKASRSGAQDAQAIELLLDGGVAELAIAEDGSVRLRASPGKHLPPDPGPGIGRGDFPAARVNPQTAEGGGVKVSFDGPHGSAHVEIAARPFSVSVRTRSGERIAELRDLAFAPDGRSRISLVGRSGERFFGFGEKAGRLDKRGSQLRMRTRDARAQHDCDPLYVAIPFVLAHTHESDANGGRVGSARGLLLDSLAPSWFDVASDGDDVVMQTDAGGLDVTLFPGPRPADAVRRFTARVGRQPLPPLWALGHHQSRWSYGSDAKVRALAKEIRARGIPTDVIHLDIDYMDRFRVFRWHPKRFPDPKQLLSDLAEQGFRVVTVVDPGVKVDEDDPIYQDGQRRGVFCKNEDESLPLLRCWPGRIALPDFNRPGVRRWWGEQHASLVGPGVAGIWNDMNEPAGWGSELRFAGRSKPLGKQNLERMQQRHPADEGELVPHEHVRNVYGLQHSRATRAYLESVNPEQRPFVLTRSGHAGIQRHAAVWTGDTESSWSHLQQSVPMLLNLSLSGVAFCGADIGGFSGSCTPELYARWMQLGAFYPFARTHSERGTRQQEPWRFGPRVEAIARSALELRMRLLPYFYALFRHAEATGAPVWRPLFYEFPDDPAAADTEDQLMIGPALLFAPVLTRGARARSVYLPEGVWFSFWDDRRYVGPRNIEIEAPLEGGVPLFVRAGSLLPTRSPVEYAADRPEEACVLEVFPGLDGAVTLVEDDGESTAYRSGVSARTELRLWHQAGGRLRLEIGRREGEFELPPRAMRVTVRACPRPDSVRVNSREVSESASATGFRFEEGRVHVALHDEGRGTTIEIEPAP